MSLDVYLKVPREQHEEIEWNRHHFFEPIPCCCHQRQSQPSCLFCQHCTKWIRPEEMELPCPTMRTVWNDNITHNLGKMAEKAWIYMACWRPEEIGITKASQLIPLLENGLAYLEARPKYFEQWNASNGWGLYKHFVPWVREYLEACRENPDAFVEASR